MGSTRNETAGWVLNTFPTLPINPTEYLLFLRAVFGSNANAVHAHYPARSKAEVRPQLALLFTDLLMTCAIRNAAVAYAGSIGGPFVSKYLFLHPPTSDPVNNVTVSQCASIHEVCHGEELDFVFHSAAFSGASMTPEEERLSDLMLSYWTNFALSETRTSAFPAYSPLLDNSLAFDLDGATQIPGYRGAMCDFWDQLGYY
jgi:para-nitrobenzyl esterase